MRRSPWMQLVSLSCLVFLLPSCSGEGESNTGLDSGADSYQSPPELAPFELRNVLSVALAEFNAEIAPSAGIGPGVEEGPSFPVIAEAIEQKVAPEDVRGLADLLSSSAGDMRALALIDATGLGPAAIPELISLASDEQAALDTRAVALEILGALGDVRAEITILELLRTLPSAHLRAHAAWRLSSGTADCVLPGLVLRLKYESDMATLCWIATALARHGNYAGAEDLWRRAQDNPGDPDSLQALGTADALAEQALGTADGALLVQAWRAGDPEQLLPQVERSAGFHLALWRWIERLADYQLRGVDDARFVFQRMDASAAENLGRALHDENVYVRTHAAECLERMGPRARSQADELTAALADRRIGSLAAAALSSIGALETEALLCSLTSDGVRLGLRLGALRALAQWGPKLSQEATDRMREIYTTTTSAELRQAAGEGLLNRDAGIDLAREMAPCLVGESPLGPVEPRTTSDALRSWLERRSKNELSVANGDSVAIGFPATEALAAWDAATIDSPFFVPPKKDIDAMRLVRRQLIESLPD